jgi:hypothetical protein
MISHLAGSPQGPSPSFFFSWGPVGSSGTRCVVGAAAAGVSFTPLLVVLFSVVVVVVFGVVLYAAAAGAAESCLTPVVEVPSSHGWALATAA